MSKQPYLKAGVVRIDKISEKSGSGEAFPIDAAQEQKAFSYAVSSKKAEATDSGVKEQTRERHLELWLGAAYEAIRCLAEKYETLFPNLVRDKEIQSGLRLMHRITLDALHALEPMTVKYRTQLTYGHTISQRLCDTLFPSPNVSLNPYETMVTLTGLVTFMSNIDAHLTALVPVSQALWDEEFIAAVNSAKSCMDRTQKWVKHQLNVRSAQTLIVPSKDVVTADMQWTG